MSSSNKPSAQDAEQAGPTRPAAEQEKISQAIARRKIDEFQWKTLCNSVYPGAKPESILMALDYCKARGLDPLKKPCHIVPMYVKDAKTGESSMRDVILPGIYEYRTTAMRTGLYMGHSEPVYGPTIDFQSIPAPEWCSMTMYRHSPHAEQPIAFPVKVYFREVVGLTSKGVINTRWSQAPAQMLTKCTEAAGLREAFPDELGGLQTDDEMAGTSVGTTETAPAQIEHTRPSAATEALRRAAGKVAPAAEKVAAKPADDKGPSPAVAVLAKAKSTQAAKSAKEDPPDDSEHRTPEGMAKLIARFQSLTSIKALEAQWTDIKKIYSNDVPIDVEASYQEHLESLQNAGIG